MKKTYRALARYAERDVVVPVLAGALDESALRESALSRLLDEQHSRAPRELVRRLHRLDQEQLDRTRDLWEQRLLVATRQLLRSDRGQTRTNVARFATSLLSRSPERLADVQPILLVLFDDPDTTVAALARHTFINAILAGVADETRDLPQRHPVLTALSILLRRFDEHGELDVIRAVFAIGAHGSDLLGRALGEHWPAEEEILEVAREMKMTDELLTVRVDGLLRWLESPYQDVRDAARRILREYATEAFLVRCAERFECEDGRVRNREYPAFRHMRWDRISQESLAGLRPQTILRIAGYTAASAVPPAEKARRLAHLLRASDDEHRLEMLGLFRELPTDEVLHDLAQYLVSPDEPVQLLTTRLLADSKRATALLIGQLRSDFESVRDLAQRRLAGRSLRIYFDSFEAFNADQRRETLRVIRKIDGTFFAQLRHALRGQDEPTIIRALRTARELDESEELEDALLDLTVTPNPRIRASLARALAIVSETPRLHYLRLFLEDDDARVVANAVDTIGELEDPRMKPWLETTRRHGSPRVRANTLLALTRHGDPEALGELRALGRAEDPQLVASARWALDQWAERGAN